jgi:hypothetical protein
MRASRRQSFYGEESVTWNRRRTNIIAAQQRNFAAVTWQEHVSDEDYLSGT